MFYCLFFLISFSVNLNGLTKPEAKLIVNYLNNEKICITTNKEEIECLDFTGKQVFITPYLDTLRSDFYLFMYNNKSFKQLANYYGAIERLESHSGQRLPKFIYQKLKFDLTNDINNADVIISFTAFVKVKKFKYCFIQITESKYKQWVIKLKGYKEKVIETEVMQILD